MLNCTPKTTAKVVDGILMLSCPNAVHPCVWQMDLAQAPVSSTEIKQMDDGRWKLFTKAPGERQQDIAEFSTRKDALSALKVISDALQSAQGSIHSIGEGTGDLGGLRAPARLAPSQRGSSFLAGLLKVFAVLALLIIIFLAVVVWLFSPDTSTMNAQPTAAPSQAAPIGVPVPADQILQQRQ